MQASGRLGNIPTRHFTVLASWLPVTVLSDLFIYIWSLQLNCLSSSLRPAQETKKVQWETDFLNSAKPDPIHFLLAL